jgi:hypothetical protein
MATSGWCLGKHHAYFTNSAEYLHPKCSQCPGSATVAALAKQEIPCCSRVGTWV